jgi:predicted MPP superfamily phosphohydrolase
MRLSKKIEKVNPDIIVITGDFIDSRRYSLETSLKLIWGINGIAPIYFVNGNHEFKSGRFEEIQNTLAKNGVKILRNAKVAMVRGEAEIEIVGIDDPSGFKNRGEFDSNLNKLKGEKFSILLSHRPEKFNEYTSRDFNLVLAGHAHGGQFRIPFLGGLIAPNQGFFPKYTAGVHKKGNTIMVISRGLGNSTIPQRIFNRPELVVVELSRR